MNPKDVKPFQTGPGGPFELATDKDGRLFSPHMREIISSHAPAEAVPAVEAFAAVGQAARLMRLNMERWAEKEGLSEMRVAILFMLRYAGGALPLGTLAGKLQVSPRNVTGLVDNLERDGLVARVHDPGDLLSALVALPCYEDDIPGPGEPDRPPDRAAAVGVDLDVQPGTLQHVLDDRQRILRARVVRGHDREIRELGGDRAHQRPFASIPVSARSEDHDHAAVG